MASLVRASSERAAPRTTPAGEGCQANRARQYRRGFTLLVAVTFLARCWTATALPLSGDEAYHWQWSRHLAGCYYDHPPLTAWLIRLSTELLGASSEFTVRLPALLCITVAAWVCYLLARDVVRASAGSELQAERAGFLAGLLILYVPITTFFSSYMSTDPPLLLCWSLALYFLFRAVKGSAWRHWLAAGITIGLAVLAKFLALLIVPVVALCVIGSRVRVPWSKLLVAGAVAVLLATPLIWWNADHDWATFRFNFQARHEGQDISLVRPAEFLLGQALVLSPLLFASAVHGVVIAAGDWLRAKRSPAALLGLTTVIPVGFFLCASVVVEVGIHWPAAGWIGILVYLAASWSLSVNPSRSARRIRSWSVATAVGLAVVMQLGALALPEVAPLLARQGWSWPGHQRPIEIKALKEIYGWRELGVRVDEARQAHRDRSEGRNRVFVICNQYGLASSVSFYSPSHVQTHLWSVPRKHGEDYRFWDDFGSLQGQDALFVTKRNVEEALPSLREHFAHVGEAEEIPIAVAGVKVRAFFLVRCRGFDGNAPFSS